MPAEEVNFLNSVPKEAWIVISGIGGALITGIITIVTTVFLNSSNTKRLNIQLSHDRDVKRQEREIAMRREIYYGAIDSIAVSVKALAQFSEIDMKTFSENSPPDLASKFYKVQLVANEETMQCFFFCSNLISESLIALTPQKLAIDSLQGEKSSRDEIGKIALEAHKDITMRMEKLNEKKEFDSPMWDSLKQASDKYMQDMNDCNDRGQELSKGIALAKIQLMKDVIPWLIQINDAIGSVIIAMRKELSGIDNKIISALKELSEESNKKNKALLNKFFDDLNKMIEA